MGDLEVRFGRLVAAHRRARRLTQEQLASQASVSVEMISKLELGKTGARFPNIQRLADALEIDPAELFSTAASIGQKRRRLQNLLALLAPLSDADLVWVEGIIRAAISPRRRLRQDSQTEFDGD